MYSIPCWDFYSPVAHQVERGSYEPKVAGSSPARSMCERTEVVNGLDLRSSCTCYIAGSNLAAHMYMSGPDVKQFTTGRVPEWLMELTANEWAMPS